MAGTTGVGFDTYDDYLPYIGLNVQSAMYRTNGTVYIRVPFSADSLSKITSLTLRMKYEDGFVAYINNAQVVASEYAPSPLEWDSIATAQVGIEAEAVVFKDFDLTPYIDALLEGNNLLAIHGLNGSKNSNDLLIMPRLETITRGDINTSDTGLLTTPTPGEPNTEINYLGYVETPITSPERGFYDAPFTVTVSNVTDGAEVRYTLNGSEPTETSPLYTGPITISATTNLRVKAFKTGWKASYPRTDSYIFIDDVITESRSTTTIQNYDGRNQVITTGMDSGVLNEIYRDAENRQITVQESLKTIPTVSITTADANLYSTSSGIYVNAVYGWERGASVEWINPDGSKGFHINAGLRMRGGYSRHADNPKHSFRLFFRDEYGEGKLNYDFFNDGGVTSFDKMDLRTSQNFSWAWYDDPRNTFLRDTFFRDSAIDMGDTCTRSSYCHLYLNGEYWGLFMTEERPEENFARDYFGGDKEDYDVVKVYREYDNSDGFWVEAAAGTLEAYERLFDAAMSGFTNDADYFAVQGMDITGQRDLNHERLLDVDNMIDFLLLIYYGGAVDNGISWWTGDDDLLNNLYGLYNRTNPDGFKWIQHDGEILLDASPDLDRTGPYNHSNFNLPQYFNPQTLHQKLSVNAEYRLKFADRVYKHFKNDGALVANNCEARLDERIPQVDRAIVAHSARWGSTSLDRDTWLSAVTNQRAFFTRSGDRCDEVIGYLTADGLIPSITPPDFSLFGGQVTAGTTITLSATQGTIYFTSDGSDPRAIGGAIAGSTYNTPITITRPTHLKARAFDGSEWSALTESTFWTPEIPLAITEVMYHAPAGNPHEFIEVQNVSYETISLGGYKLDNAIDFNFKNGPATLAPGAYMVIVDDIDAFSSTYPTNGIIIAGEYSGDLSNGGEKVDLEFNNHDLVSFTYSDARNWPQSADGVGHSLVPINVALATQESGSLDYGENWRASTYINGSPGYMDPPTGKTVLINEIIAHTDTGLAPPFDSNDQIELYNPTASPITLSGWYLSDDPDDLTKFAIPTGTTVPPFGFVWFDENDFHPARTNGFGLNKASEQVLLSVPFRIVDVIRFKGQENGASLGRYPDGSTDWVTTVPTTGSANQVPGQTLQISELMYHPLAPAGSEMEYIIIENMGVTNEPLYTSAGSYRIDGGVSYTFPPGMTLASGEKIRLVSFDPITDSGLLAQFCATYGLTGSEAIYGPYKGELSNRGERVALERPQDSDDPLNPADISWVVVDELFYSDQDPWPTSADGEGYPLIRTGLLEWSTPSAPVVGVSPTSIYNLIIPGEVSPDSTFEVWNAGVSNLDYSISTDAPWLSVSPTNGSSMGEYDNIAVSYNSTGLWTGFYTGRVEVASGNAFYPSRSINVVLEIDEQKLDHFSWDAIGTNQAVDQPFSVSITARDVFDAVVQSFTDAVSVSATRGDLVTPEVQIGTATTNHYYPLTSWLEDARTQVIYLQSELGGASRISSLALNLNSIPAQALETWTIRMRHTPLNSYGTTPPAWESDWTTVYQSDQSFTSTGWTVFEFETPFDYNGTDNLMIDFSFNNSSSSTGGYCDTTDTHSLRALFFFSDSQHGDPLTWAGTSNPPRYLNTLVPDIRLGLNGVSVSPEISGNFVNGIWAGMLTVHEAASNVVLKADDGNGHTAESNPFNVIVINFDADNDGIPDSWETAFFGSPSNCVATIDVDGDGHSNLQEYITGMDPTNAASRFEVEQDKLPDGFVINWNPVDGRFYDVLWSPELLQGFRILEPAIPYPVNSYTDRVHSAASAGYYRVAVRMPSANDLDADGLPNEWEFDYFTDPTNAIPKLDDDGDGQDNISEYLAGTNPTNSASRFEVYSTNTASLYWNSVTGRTYSVLWTEDLREPFSLITNGLTIGNYTDGQHTNDTPGFHMITVERGSPD